MKLGFWVLVALAAGALAAHVLLPDNGYVLLSFRGYVVEMSVPVLAFLLVLTYVAIRLLIQIWRAPRKLGEAWARARVRYAGRQATQGYIALAEGKLARGERLLTRDARRSETPLLNYLAAARAAQMQGDRARRDGWLRMACEQEPAATDAVLLTQAELQLEDGQYDEALASLMRVRERHPNHAQALKLLGELHHRRRQWQPLAGLLPVIRRRGNVSAEILDEWTVDSYTSMLTAPDLDPVALDRLWDEIPKTLRREPRLAVARARALLGAGDIEGAEADLRRAIPDSWDEQLLEIYGQLEAADPATHLKRIEAWLKDRPEDPALLLAAGRASIRHQLWGKARSYLETSLAIRPLPATYHVLGQLMLRVGENQSAARAFEKGLAISVDAPSVRPASRNTLPAPPLPRISTGT